MRHALFLTLFLAACGGGKDEMKPAAAPSTLPPANAPSDLPSTSIKRSVVNGVVQAGMGAFLQNVTVDTDKPVYRSGRFYGYTITRLPREWASVDLKVGDVVTQVNGFSVERPETAFEAFQSLKVASELRVDYERNGEPRALRYAIVDD